MSIPQHEKLRLIIPFFTLILILLIVPIINVAYPQSDSSLDPKVILEQNVDNATPKPGDKINFNITYSNPMSRTAYNVTIFEWMPSGLIFISSKPFYDGVSNPDEGFFRWSRGNVEPGGAGTIIVSAMVDDVPVGTNITNIVYLTYEYENGTIVEVTSSVSIIVAQGASVHVYPDQIHGIPPYTNAETNYNITVSNTGNAPDVFNISLSSIAFDPTPAGKNWTIELYNSTGHLIATLKDEASNDHSSWTEWGTLTTVTLETGESMWFIIRVIEPGGTSGSGDAYIKIRLTATSQFDPNISDTIEATTVVRKKVGITLAPDNANEANPGETITYLHELYNGGQTEVIDMNYTSSQGWMYSFYFANGTALKDTDNSGYVDVGEIAKDEHANILVKMTVPYGTAAGIIDNAVITAKGVTSGNYDNANDTTTVKCAPAIGVTKKLISGNPTYVGETIIYRINVTNLGNTKLTKVPLDDTFETTCLNFSSADPVPDDYSKIAGTIHWENLTSLEPLQSAVVTVNFVAIAGDDIVRESANVIDAVDQFGNLISAVYVNTELKTIQLYTLTIMASPPEALGGTFEIAWTERGFVHNETFTTPTQITCDENTNATVSNPQDPIVNGKVRYVFNDYSPSQTVTIESDLTIVLNYWTQYLVTFNHTGLDDTAKGAVVTINNEPKIFADLPFSMWVDNGSTVTYSYEEYVLSGVDGKRFRLDKAEGPISPITVIGPVTVTGNYVIQYKVTFTQTGLSLDATGTVVTVNSSEKTFGALPFDIWVDTGSILTYSYEATVSSTISSKQYRLDSVTGPASPITVTADTTVTGNHVTQHLVTFAQTGLDSTATGTVLTINGDAKDLNDLPFTVWVDSRDSITYSYSGTVSSSISGKRFILDNVTGPASPINVTGLVTVTGNYQTQYEVTFDQSGISGDFTGTIVTVDGTGYGVGDLPKSFWWDENSNHNFTFASPLVVNGTKQYVWISTTGLSSSQSGSITGTEPGNITGNHKTQYYLIMNTNFGTAAPSSGWHDAGSTIQISASAPSVVDGERYVWLGWSGTGSGSYSSTDNLASITMNGPITETASWKHEYYLTVTSTYGSPTPTSGWFVAGTEITASVNSPWSEATSVRYVCIGWTGIGSVPSSGITTSATFTINEPSSIAWNWKTQYYLTVSTNFGTVSPSDGWYDSGSIVLTSAEPPLVVEGKGYVWYGWAGTGAGSYNGLDNPANITVNSAVTETAHWKIAPELTIFVSNETLARCDRIVVYGRTLPVNSTAEVEITYTFPNGTQLTHTVQTDNEGQYNDTLLLTEESLYGLFAQSGEWAITANRLEDVNREATMESTTLEVQAPELYQFHPALFALLIIILVAIAYIVILKRVNDKKDNHKRWWHATVILGLTGLAFGVASLALNWISVVATATTNGETYLVNISLHPFSPGSVSITEIQYMGSEIPSLTDSAWWNIPKSPGPVITLYLVPVGCILALASLYKPKTQRQRIVKIVTLVIAGALIMVPVAHSLMFAQTQANTIAGASTGYSIGLYIAMISGLLVLLSSLFAARETPIKMTQASATRLKA